MPTLYLNGYWTSAYCKSRRIEVTKLQGDKPLKMTVPYDDIDRVIIIGNATVSTQVIGRLMRRDIPVHYLSPSGRWLGTLSNHKSGNIQRRLTQYSFSQDKTFSLQCAQACITAKIKNSRRVLQRLAGNRDWSHSEGNLEVMRRLKHIGIQASGSLTIDELRGCEGLAAAVYFKRLALFFPEDLPFEERSRRPPKNEANALLSWTYTIFLAEIEAAVRMRNLDPALGCLHSPSYNTPSLALDLLEAFRAPVCDMLALKLFNHKIIRGEHFEPGVGEKGGVFLSEEGRKVFFGHYEKHVLREFTPSGGGSHTNFRKIIDQQVLAYIDSLENGTVPQFFHMP